jgi:hypothetical protein
MECIFPLSNILSLYINRRTVSMSTRLWSGWPSIRVHFLVGTTWFSLLHNVKINYGAHSTSYKMDIMPKNNFIRFGVIMAVTMMHAIFWDVTPCSSCKNWCFGGTYHLQHQDKKNQQARNISSQYNVPSADSFHKSHTALTSQKKAFFNITLVIRIILLT